MSLTPDGVNYAIDRWEWLIHRGLTVTVTYGPYGHMGIVWTVKIGYRTGMTPEYVGRDIAHCVEIAEREARARSWVRD